MSDPVAEIFRQAKTIAVVGLSDDESRPSYEVAAYLQSQGYEIIPVNPRLSEALGAVCYPDLHAVPKPVDVVDVFRRSEHVVPIARAAVEIGAKVALVAGRGYQRGGRGDRAGGGPRRRHGRLHASEARRVEAAGRAVVLRPMLFKTNSKRFHKFETKPIAKFMNVPTMRNNRVAALEGRDQPSGGVNDRPRQRRWNIRSGGYV